MDDSLLGCVGWCRGASEFLEQLHMRGRTCEKCRRWIQAATAAAISIPNAEDCRVLNEAFEKGRANREHWEKKGHRFPGA